MQRAISKREQQLQQEKMEAIQAQNDGLAAIEKQKMASAVMLKKVETEEDLKKIIIQGMLDLEKTAAAAGHQASNTMFEKIMDGYLQQYAAQLQPQGAQMQ
jgi:hypothetical protein